MVFLGLAATIPKATRATRAEWVPSCDTQFQFLNSYMLPELQALVKSNFFKYYRVSLCSQCMHENLPPPMCGSPECGVCECSRNDLPCDTSGKCFLEPQMPSDSPECTSGKALETHVDLVIDSPNIIKWGGDEGDPWVRDDNNEKSVSYVDLTRNPERWTGYTSEQKSDWIWKAIYEDNCGSLDDTCTPEQEFLHTVISGLHTSITTHILTDCCIERVRLGPCLKWGVDYDGVKRRVLGKDSYVQNLHFLLRLLLEAVHKAKSALLRVDYEIDDGDSCVEQVKKVLEIASTCSAASPSVKLPPDLSKTRTLFRNISSIIDCVGCDKCKLWGKLQFTGVGTALRILFTNPQNLRLRRTEVIALLNTLTKLSESVDKIGRVVEELKDIEYAKQRKGSSELFQNFKFIKKKIMALANRDTWDRCKRCSKEAIAYACDAVSSKVGYDPKVCSERIGIAGTPAECTYGDKIRAVVVIYFTALACIWSLKMFSYTVSVFSTDA